MIQNVLAPSQCQMRKLRAVRSSQPQGFPHLQKMSSRKLLITRSRISYDSRFPQTASELLFHYYRPTMRYIVNKLSDEFYWLICARAMVYAPFHGCLVNSGLQEKIPYLVIQDVTFRSLGYFLYCLNRSEFAGPSISPVNIYFAHNPCPHAPSSFYTLPRRI